LPTLLNDSSLDKSRFNTNFRLRFGFDLLKWIVLILLPSFLVCALGLVSYEVYYELSTTGGKGKRFKKLVASLRLAGERRTLADVKTIHEILVETDFLRPYPYSKLAKICRECELRELKPQETLFSQGDVGVHFFVLIKGTVDVYVGGKGCINSHHDQASFGELALLQVTRSVCSALPSSADTVQIAFCRNQASAPHLSSAGRRRCSLRSTVSPSST